MDTDELLQLIIAAPIAEDKKSELIKALNNGAPVDEVVAGYESVLNAMSEEVTGTQFDVQKVPDGVSE